MDLETKHTGPQATTPLRRLFGTLVAIALTVGVACSGPDTNWSASEKENIQHFFKSGEANRAAVAYSNNGSMPFDESEYLDLQRRALTEATLVQDNVLAKAHPELPETFRNLYQKSLELSIEAFENKDNAASLQSSSLHDQWVDWYNAHIREIRIPR